MEKKKKKKKSKRTDVERRIALRLVALDEEEEEEKEKCSLPAATHPRVVASSRECVHCCAENYPARGRNTFLACR